MSQLRKSLPARRVSGLALALAGAAAGIGGWVHVRVGAERLDLWTGLLFLLGAGLAAWALVELAMGALRFRPELRSGVRVSMVTLLLLLPASELFVRFGLDRYATYFERNGRPGYESLLRASGPSWFHVWEPRSQVEWTTAEFTHRRDSNALGLSEREIPVAKAPGEYRVIALGDSFTEGVGADYASSWVRVLERELAARLPDRQVTAVNAGISGSDVVFAYVLLREKLLALDPDLVLVAVNLTDVEDLVLRGGLERFQPDGSFRARRTPPRWEWLYGISYLVRAVVHELFDYDALLIPRRELEAERARARDGIRASLEACAELARSHGFRFAAVFQPDRGEAASRAWALGLGRLIAELRDAGVPVIDVLAGPRGRELAEGAGAGRLYWEIDGHHTAEGYAVLGRAIADGLDAIP